MLINKQKLYMKKDNKTTQNNTNNTHAFLEKKLNHWPDYGELGCGVDMIWRGCLAGTSGGAVTTTVAMDMGVAWAGVGLGCD